MDPTSANIGIGRLPPNLARLYWKLVQLWPDPGRHQICSTLDQTGPTSRQLLPISAKHRRRRPKLGGLKQNLTDPLPMTNSPPCALRRASGRMGAQHNVHWHMLPRRPQTHSHATGSLADSVEPKLHATIAGARFVWQAALRGQKSHRRGVWDPPSPSTCPPPPGYPPTERAWQARGTTLNVMPKRRAPPVHAFAWDVSRLRRRGGARRLPARPRA